MVVSAAQGQLSPWSPPDGSREKQNGPCTQLSGDADIFVIFAVCVYVKLRLVVIMKTAPSV